MNNDEKAMSFYDERNEETRSSSPFDENNQSPTIKRDDSIDLASVIKQAKKKKKQQLQLFKEHCHHWSKCRKIKKIILVWS